MDMRGGRIEIHSFISKAFKVERSVLPSMTVTVSLTLSFMNMVLITQQMVPPVAGYILPQIGYIPYKVRS